MNPWQLVGIAFALYLVFGATWLIWTRGKGKFILKRMVNGLPWLCGLVWALVMVTMGVMLVVEVGDWKDALIVEHEFSGDTVAVMDAWPLFIAVTVLVLAVYALRRFWKWAPWKYTEWEKFVLSAEETRGRERIARLLGNRKWLKKLLRVQRESE